MPETAVVILNWNGIDYLRKFLKAVVEYSARPGTTVYVADNGSTDGSADWIAANHSQVNLIRLDKNHGFAGGYNLALEQIKADYFILLNSDIEVTPGWLDPLIKAITEDKNVAACQPKILSWSKRDSFEYAGASGGYIDKYGYPFCRGRIFGHLEEDRGQYDDPVDIFWTSGACMAVRAEAWRRCGGFDSSFFAHMEEIDLCWRMHLAGYKLRCIPESVVYHVGGGTLPYDSPFKIYLNFRNNLFLLYKNLNNNKLQQIMFIRRLLDGMAAMMFLFRGNFSGFRSIWKAHMDFYRNLDSLKAGRKKVQELSKENYYAPHLNKSIVFEFYAKGKKTFSSLNLTK